MKRKNILWTTLIVSVALLIGYGIFQSSIFKDRYNISYDQGFYGGGLRRGFPNDSGYKFNNNNERLSVDQIKEHVNDYLTNYRDKLEIADIFVYRDSDYYISIIEKDTGRGAMEIMVNPFTGEIYPEYGPNMMWNEKYNMHGGYNMMDNRRWNMMRGTQRYNSSNYNYNYNRNDSEEINKEEAVEIVDEYVKNNIGQEFSVLGEGYKFYGYYTFYISNRSKVVGLISLNYYTGEVWYHDWHGELEKVILNN